MPEKGRQGTKTFVTRKEIILVEALSLNYDDFLKNKPERETFCLMDIRIN